MIDHVSTLDGVTASDLEGFFEGWAQRPSPQAHLRLLERSSVFVLARERRSSEIVGFVTALSDGLLSATLPLLEVKPQHRGRGIGSGLVRRVLALLEPLYMVDLSCDPELRPFYEALGFRATTAMVRRDYSVQGGRSQEKTP